MFLRMFRKKEFNDPILAALHARLNIAEEEIARVTNLAAGDSAQAREHWDLAVQLQRDAREIRDAMRSREHELQTGREDSDRSSRLKSCYSVFVGGVGSGFRSVNCRWCQ